MGDRFLGSSYRNILPKTKIILGITYHKLLPKTGSILFSPFPMSLPKTPKYDSKIDSKPSNLSFLEVKKLIQILPRPRAASA